MLEIGRQALDLLLALQGDRRSRRNTPNSLSGKTARRSETTSSAPKQKITTAHLPESADKGTGGELVISGIHVGIAWIMRQVAARRRNGQVLIALMDGRVGL